MDIPDGLRDTAARWQALKRWERRELGQNLRLLGLSYAEIQEIIAVPKGTLSGWCRDLQLTPEQEQRLRTLRPSQATRRRAAAARRGANLKRIEAIRSAARQEAARLRADPFWMAGTVAYWAEGSKGGKLGFSNSDPDLVVLFTDWARWYLALERNRFTVTLHLHDGQNEVERKEFWSRITGIPLAQFRRTFIKPEGTGHRKNVLYNGTAQVRVTRSGDLLHRVLGWIDAIRTPDLAFDTLAILGR